MNGNTPVFDGYVIRTGMRANSNHDGCRIALAPMAALGDDGGRREHRELRRTPTS